MKRDYEVLKRADSEAETWTTKPSFEEFMVSPEGRAAVAVALAELEKFKASPS